MLSREELARRVESPAPAGSDAGDGSSRPPSAPTLDTICKVAEALGTTGPAITAEQASVELTELVQSLPPREQEIACVLLRALSEHAAASSVSAP